jgi:hypothetical protein
MPEGSKEEEVRFATDSLVEGGGFEPSVPLRTGSTACAEHVFSTAALLAGDQYPIRLQFASQDLSEIRP